MSQHFPEILGLTFAGSILLVFVVASGEGSAIVAVGTTGAVVLAALRRSRRRRP